MLRAIIDQLLLTWRLLRDSRVPLWAKAIPVAAVVYVLSPIDLIPDFIIGLGQLDDLGIFLGSMRLMESVAPGYVVDEHRAALNRRHTPLETVDAPAYTISHPEEEKPKRG
ncbi:MAG: DUF1232 domain-containing protein [Anaerolineae bacterium]|nr:DUF1232 domain-containing protein [Anaerolineae bacterium]